MPRVLVGLPSLLGDIKKYKEKYDIVELSPVDSALTRATTLRSCPKMLSPWFVFSVVLPRAVGGLSSSNSSAEAELAQSLEVARAVEARCLVLMTPPEVRPTAANRKRLAALVDKLPRTG